MNSFNFAVKNVSESYAPEGNHEIHDIFIVFNFYE